MDLFYRRLFIAAFISAAIFLVGTSGARVYVNRDAEGNIVPVSITSDVVWDKSYYNDYNLTVCDDSGPPFIIENDIHFSFYGSLTITYSGSVLTDDPDEPGCQLTVTGPDVPVTVEFGEFGLMRFTESTTLGMVSGTGPNEKISCTGGPLVLNSAEIRGVTFDNTDIYCAVTGGGGGPLVFTDNTLVGGHIRLNQRSSINISNNVIRDFDPTENPAHNDCGIYLFQCNDIHFTDNSLSNINGWVLRINGGCIAEVSGNHAETCRVPAIEMGLDYHVEWEGATAWESDGSIYPVLTDKDFYIQAGAILTMNDMPFKIKNARIVNYGSFLASNVIFTSFWDDSIGGDIDEEPGRDPAVGDWKQIELTSPRESADIFLDSCEIRYAGEDRDYYGALTVTGDNKIVELNGATIRNSKRRGIFFSSGGGSLEVANCVITESGTDAISADSGDLSLTDTQIENNVGRAVSVPAPLLAATIADNFGQNNGCNAIRMNIPSRNGNLILGYNDGLPYWIEALFIDVDKSLTLDAGAILKIDDGVTVDCCGDFTSNGVCDNPVIITSIHDDTGGDTDGEDIAPAPGDWTSWHFQGNRDVNAYFIEFRYGGADPSVGMVHQTSGRSFSLFGGGCRNSASHGLRLNSFMRFFVRSFTLEDNLGDGVLIDDGRLFINDGSFVNNSGYGLRNNGPEKIADARFNWWGSAAGPGGAGPGSGDEVSELVDFDQWLLSAPDDPCPGTPTPTHYCTGTPTATFTFTATPTNSPTYTNTPTFTRTPTNAPMNTPTNTPTSTNTPTAAQTSTPTNSPTNTNAPTPTNSPTLTHSPTPTNSPTPANTASPTASSTSTATSTFTDTPTVTPTFTPRPEPEIAIRMSQSVYRAGDALIAEVRIANKGQARTVDVYLVIEALGGFYSYPSFAPGVTPIRVTLDENFEIPFTKILDLPLTNAPPLTASFHAALALARITPTPLTILAYSMAQFRIE